MGPTDTTFVLGFDAGLPSVPFDFTIGLERCRATANPASKTLTVTRGVNGTPTDSHYGGPNCGIAECRHQFIVTNPDGSVIDLTAIAETLTTEWVMPGGESQHTVSFHTYDPARYLPDPDGLLVCSSNESGTYRAYASGLLVIPKETRFDDGSYHYELVFSGIADTLGANGDEYLDTTPPTPGYFDSGYGWWAAFTPIHLVLTDAIRDIAYYFVGLDWSHVLDGGQQIGKEYNGQWKTVAQIINELTAQGDDGEPLDWAVLTGDDGVARFWLYRRSRWLHINIPWGSVVLPQTVPLSWNWRDHKNRAVVKYNGGSMQYAADTLVAERPKTAHRDISSSTQDAKTAYDLAKTIISQASLNQTMTENGVTFEYKADDPSTLYLTDEFGGEIPLWRGGDIIGRRGVFTGITATNDRWPITDMQVKSYRVDHVAKTGSCQFGAFNDWTKAFSEAMYAEQQRPDSTFHLSPPNSQLASSPQFQNPYGAVTQNMPTLGPGTSGPYGGGIGPHQVQADIDMIPPQWSYDDPTGTPLPEGPYGVYQVHHNGNILGFNFFGTDGAGNGTTGVIKIYKGHGAGGATLVSTIAVSGILGGEIFPDSSALEIVPGDYLRLVIDTNDASTGLAHVAVSAQLRRTGGTDRPTSTAGATLMSVTTTRDADTGITTFHVTADRPCRAWVAFDVQAGPYRNVTGTTPNLSKVSEPSTFAMPSGVTMHGSVRLITADNVISIGPDFIF